MMHSLLAGNDAFSDSTSYYAEYDPFDFLYSADNGTQYSDPMYEAVNRCDKSTAYSGSVSASSVGWRQDYITQSPSPSPTPSTSATAAGGASAIVRASTSGSISPPPPLPPRNQQLYEATKQQSQQQHHQPSPFTDSFTKNIPANIVLDRRKTCARLYELISEQPSEDAELLEFYHMVRELRASYHYTDEATNVGHVIAAEFNYHYMMDTSIKVIVHPAMHTLQQHAMISSLGGEQVKGYGAPVTFTCDSK